MTILLFKSFLPEFFLFCCILYLLILNTKFLVNLKKIYILENELFSQIFFILFCLIFLFFNQKLEGIFLDFLFVNDNSSNLVKIVFLVFSVLACPIMFQNFKSQKINFLEYFILYLLVIFGLFLLINCYDLISAYLILELQALCFYILASFNRSSSFSIESGLKYFIIGSFISGFFLFGCLLVYAVLGTTNFQKILLLLLIPFNENLNVFNLVLLVGVIIITSTLLFKVAVFPFHFWAADVYEGAPLISTIIFTVLTKLSLFTLFIRWLSVVLPNFIELSFFLILSGIGSIFVGAYMAIDQKRFKRFIIYSSISQMGFVITVLSVYTLNAYTSVYFYLIVYLFSILVLWSCLTIIYSFNFTKNKFFSSFLDRPVFLTDLNCLFRSNYFWSILILIIFFSFAGIPPFSGFLAKIFIILSLIDEKIYFVSFLLVLLSVLSSFYYMRIVKIIFFEKQVFSFSLLRFYSNFKTDNLNGSIYVIKVLLTFILFLNFFFPTFFILLSNLIVLSFFGI